MPQPTVYLHRYLSDSGFRNRFVPVEDIKVTRTTDKDGTTREHTLRRVDGGNWIVVHCKIVKEP